MATPATIELTISYVDGGEVTLDDTITLAEAESRSYSQPYSRDGRVRSEFMINDERQEVLEWQARAEQGETNRTVEIRENEVNVEIGGP